MKRKYILSSTPIALGASCLVISSLIGSRVEPDGTLVEPFFLIPTSFLLFLIGIISLVCVYSISIFKKKQA